MICVRREFNVWANGKSSPIVDWLRAVGVCLAGGFALAMMTEPAVVAPGLSQPLLPLGNKGAGRIDASDAEIACAKRRFEAEDLTMMALRFPSDHFVPHTVLTWHLIDEPGSATKQIEQDVITFFKARTAA